MIFPQFKDVKPQDVRKRETSNLELLLQLGKEILTEPDLKNFPKDDLRASEVYENKASKINYDARDIESFILANTDKAYTEQQWAKLGIFTGALVSALTQKQAQTTINIDLGNRTFHCLFALTRHANNIIVKNLKGNYAFWLAGSHQGSVRNIAGLNIIGDHAFWHAGDHQGRVGNITGINITGHRAFWAGNHQGRVGNITGINVKGYCAVEYVGSDQGSIESITGINITGNSAFSGAGSDEGRVGVVRYYDIKGPFSFVAANIRQEVLLSPQQADEYLNIVKEIESSGKSNDEIQRMIEQLNLLGGKE